MTQRTPPRQSSKPPEDPPTVVRAVRVLRDSGSLINLNTPLSSKRQRPEDGTYMDDETNLRDILIRMESRQLAGFNNLTAKMDSHHTDLSAKMDTVGSRVVSLESAMEKATSDIGLLQQKMDDFEQDKLATHMVINGADPIQVDANKSNIKQFAVSLIRSFNIVIDSGDVEDAFSFPVGANLRRIVVIFRSSARKSSVMSAKRAVKDGKKIYFDHRVTAAVGEILRNLRGVAKDRGGRAFLYGGRVFYQKDSEPRVRISSLEAVEILKNAPQ